MGCKALVLGVWFLLLMYFLLLVFGNIVLVEELHDDGHFKIRTAARSSVVVESYSEKKKKKDRGVDHWDDHMSPYHPAAKAVDINYMSKRRVPNGADPIHNRRAGKYQQPPSKT